MVAKTEKPKSNPCEDSLVYVFSPSKSNRTYQIQMETLNVRHLSLEDHHVMIAEVFEDEDGRIGIDNLPCDRCRGLREQFQIGPGKFKILLVDKDSEVKLCAESCVSCEELFMRLDKLHAAEAESAY